MERGEVLFDVAHDEKRPFLVIAGDTTIRAIGTAFNVELNDRNIEVTVTDGIVEVETAYMESIQNQGAKPAGSLLEIPVENKRPAQIRAGQTAIIVQTMESLQPIDAIAIEKKLSWQQGVVVFEGETLEQVVAEISRYTTKTFLISDDGTRSIRIGG